MLDNLAEEFYLATAIIIDQRSIGYFRLQHHINRMIDARHTRTEQGAEESSWTEITPPNHHDTALYFKAELQDLMTIFTQDDSPSTLLAFTANPKTPSLYKLVALFGSTSALL